MRIGQRKSNMKMRNLICQMLSRATVLPGKTKAKLWTFDNTLILAQKFGVQGRNS